MKQLVYIGFSKMCLIDHSRRIHPILTPLLIYVEHNDFFVSFLHNKEGVPGWDEGDASLEEIEDILCDNYYSVTAINKDLFKLIN